MRETALSRAGGETRQTTATPLGVPSCMQTGYSSGHITGKLGSLPTGPVSASASLPGDIGVPKTPVHHPKVLTPHGAFHKALKQGSSALIAQVAVGEVPGIAGHMESWGLPRRSKRTEAAHSDLFKFCFLIKMIGQRRINEGAE